MLRPPPPPPPHSGFVMDDTSLFFLLNRRLSIFTRCLSVRLIYGLAVLVLAGGSVSAWAQGESVDPIEDFCDLVMAGGSNGAGCAALAEDAASQGRVSYEPGGSFWLPDEGPTVASGSALFSATFGLGKRSCLRMRLNEDRRLLAAEFVYIVDAGSSTGTLTIVLHRDGEGADDEEILRESGVGTWTTATYTVDLSQSRVIEISICYESSGGGDAGLDRAGVDNIRLDTVSSLADFCDLVVEGGSGGSSCAALAEDEDSGAKVSYVPAQSPWHPGEGPTADSGLALFSGAVEPAKSSCLRMRLNEDQLLLAAEFGYTVDGGNSTGALTIALHRDGEGVDGEEILRASGVVAWTSGTYTVDPSQSRVVGISICYEKGSGIEAGLDWAGVDNIRLETVSSLTDFCDLVMEGGSGGSSCAALVEDEGSGARVGYVPEKSPWRLSDGPTADSGQALFSADVGSGDSSCLRLRLSEDRRLQAAEFGYTIEAVTSTGTLTIVLHRDGEGADDEEILRESGEVAWTTGIYTADLSQSRVAGISICYEKGSGQDSAGVDNIRLDTASPLADFCDLVVEGGSGGARCAALDVVAGSRVAYTPPQSPWVLDRDAAGSGLALFSADVGSGESSCMQLRFPEEHALTRLSLDYRVPSEESGGMLTIELQRDGEEENELILRPSSPRSEWVEFRHTVNLDRARVSGLLACYQQGAMAGLASDRAGLDDLSFVYEYVYDRNEFCDVAVEGGSAGENCEWILAVQSSPVNKLWEDSASLSETLLSPSWAVAELSFSKESCLRLLVQPRRDSSVWTGLSFSFRTFGPRDGYEFRIQRVGQQNSESIRDIVQPNQDNLPVESYTSDLDLTSGFISSFIVCYSGGLARAPSRVQFELNAIQFEDEVIAVSRLGSTLPPRLFHLARRSPSVDFAVQVLSQFGTVIDAAVQTTLTVRSGVAGMRLSLTVPETGQFASGEGEVSLPLSVSREQNVVLGFNIPFALADGTTLAVTVSAEEEAIAGQSRELRLFDFCGLAVQGGRDDEGGADFQRSCSDFALAVSALRFDPPDKPWRLGEGPAEDSGQALFSAELGSGESSCLRLRLNEERQLLVARIGYTVDAGTLTISLERDGEAADDILRASGEVAWTSRESTVALGRSPIVGISICYEKGTDGGDAGLDWAGVDNIRLDTVDPFADFCDLVMEGGSSGASCAALAEDEDSGSKVSYEPAGIFWSPGEGQTEDSEALFGSALGPGDRSCLRLRLNEDRQLLAAKFGYTVSAGTSTGALTIAFERDGEAAEEILRQSGEVAWTTKTYTVDFSRAPVVGISICYEKGSGIGAGLDRAGVDNIRLDTVDPVTDFCDLVMAGGSGGSSCAALAEAAVSGDRVGYEPVGSFWRLGEGPPEDFGPALFSAAVGPGESSCLRLRLRGGPQLVALGLASTVSAGTSTGALTIALHRDGEGADGEEILRQSGVVAWTTRTHMVDLGQSPVVGISICYEKGSGTEAGLDWAGVDNIRLETASPVVDFCDLVMVGGSGGSSCAALAEATESSARVSYVPAKSPWRLGEGPPEDSGLALFSAAVEPAKSSCLRLRLREGRQLLALGFASRVSAGDSTGALTISLERDGEAAEEILRESGEVDWATESHTVAFNRSRVVGISICYERGSGGGDAGLDGAGVDNIQLETLDTRVEFCNLVVTGGSGGSNCALLSEGEDSGAKVSYDPPGRPWRRGDGNSGLALFSALVERSCLRLQFREEVGLATLNFAYTVVSAGTSSGALTIELQRDEEENELILRRSTPESEWTEFRHVVSRDRARVSGLLACYQQEAREGSTPDWAGLDDLRFTYEEAYDRNEFCDAAVQGGSAGENCKWIRGVQSSPVDKLWGVSTAAIGRQLIPSSWAINKLNFREMSCLRLLLQPRRDSSLLAGLSFDFRWSGTDILYEFFIQRVGQQNPEKVRSVRTSFNRASYTYSDLGLTGGLISNFILCYSTGQSIVATSVQFELNALQFQSETVAVSRLRSTLPPRLFQFARRPQSANFAVQGLNQLGTVIDSAVQTTLTARSRVAGMRLSLTVPDTGQSASGVGEVSLPLSFSGEQNVVLGFNIPLAVADGTTLEVTVSGNGAVAGESRELRLFDFCGLTVHGGRDDEGEADLRQSCSDFALVVPAVYFDPPNKPWRVAAPGSFAIDNSLPQLAPNGQASTPTKSWRASGQPDLRLYSPPLERFEKSCMHLQLSPLATVTEFSLYWFLTSASGDDFTISLDGADTNGEEEVLRESGWVESWAPFSHTVGSDQPSRISFCYERTALVPNEQSGAGVDNLRLEYTLPPVEFTGDETVTKDDLLLALRTVGDCSDPAVREDCIANKLSALAANLGLGALGDVRMASITEALLALNSTATSSAYDFDRSGAVNEMDFRVLLRYLAGLRGAALVETEGGDPPNEFILRALLGR